MALREASKRDRSMLVDEVAELRGTVESMWSKGRVSRDASPDSYFFKFSQRSPSDISSPEPRILHKECEGDEEETNSLYEMVKEAPGDDVRPVGEIENERKKREADMADSKNGVKQ